MSTDNNPPEQSSPTDLTVEEFCSYIAPAVWDQDTLLTWPPDVFAVVASLLLKSGAYCYAVSGWKRSPNLKTWIRDVRRTAEKWRENPKDPPAKIRRWHRTLSGTRHRSIAVSEIRSDETLCKALLGLLAAADEACAGVGLGILLHQRGKGDSFSDEASVQLWIATRTLGLSTLCKDVRHSAIRVLPKMHTPQSGITIRSLTHNLALCPAGDVRAMWSERIPPENRRQHCLNLLLVPWPLTVNPSHIQSVDPEEAELRDMPKRFGFFEYQPPRESGVRRNLMNLLTNARKVVPDIHGVVFPELALTQRQHTTIRADLLKQDVFLICGVRQAGKNYLRFELPVKIPGPGKRILHVTMGHQQNKHHRWRLDKRQIVQYGLGSCLDVERKWWEHISIRNRELYFVALDDWLIVCPLICEDLARQDPVAEIVRAVGPNLVIALLMDGPQLNTRWPARYATVLADDPGSSVLTLTSVGMCELSRPPSEPKRSRAVALWKDAKTGEAVSIELPQDKQGVILSLSCVFRNEWTADGRDDAKSTGYPTLSGIHYVSFKD